MKKIDHALKLAELGFRVFPLRSGSKKPPADFAWKEEATRDPARISEWWGGDPNLNIGVAMGEGTIVVDADTKDGKPGLASLETLDMLGLPQSYRVKTPSGGLHVYLRAEKQHNNRVNSIPDYPGIDIRSDDGYVLGPGSVIDGKTYEAIPGEIEPAGEWLEDILLKNAPKHILAKTKDPVIELDLPEHLDLAVDYLVKRAPEAVEGAGGNETTYRVAAQCRDFGLSPDTTFDLMLEHWNEAKAFPAWLPADLQTVVGNAYKYATGEWGGRTAVAEFEAIDIDVGERPAETEKPAPGKTKVLKLLDYQGMSELQEPTWLIEGLVMQQSAALIFGRSNAFKSFLAVDAALSVATGRPWHGKPVVQKKVLFVTTEGAIGVGKLRIPGWYDFHKIPDEGRFNAWLYPDEISLDVKESIDILVETIRVYGIGLVVLDIFGGTMNGTEVEDTTARAWVRSVQRLVRDLGATVLTVAHTGWQDDTRARMHTHFWGSFDSRIKVEGDKEKLTTVATIERHKDSDSRGEFGFKLEPFNKTLVPVLDDSIAKKGHSGLPPKLQLALSALEEAMKANGELMTGEKFPDCAVVHMDIWRDQCSNMGLSGSQKEEARRKAFRRAFDDLRQKGIVETWADYAWTKFDREMLE